MPSACPAGTFKNSLGANACNSCPQNSNTTATASTDPSACLCIPGFTGPNGGNCTGTCIRLTSVRRVSARQLTQVRACPPPTPRPACALNTYKSGLGNATCSTCPANSVTLTTGRMAIGDCVCSPGYGGTVVTACVACVANTYKSTTATETCVSCPANSVSTGTGATSSSACQCAAGYTGPNGGPCTGTQ